MAMAALKSLGLAGAKKALRKLFRRVLPAGDEADKDKDKDSSWSQQSNDYKDNADNNNDDGDDNNNNSQSIISTAMAHLDDDKENQPPPNHQHHHHHQHHHVDKTAQALAALKLGQTGDALAVKPASSSPQQHEIPVFDDPAVMEERAEHLRFIGEALDMARLALKTNETPVGCVLVHDGKVIARGMNATNVTRNGTRHAEFMAISALLSYPRPGVPRKTCLKPKQQPPSNNRPEYGGGSDAGSGAASMTTATESEYRAPDEGNEDGSKGHLYPYGQKLHPAPKVDRRIIRESILYVTVEPCVMCASLLRQLGIKKVYFGAVNDKFGGTGGVFSIHANSLPVGADGQTASAHPTPKPIQFPDGGGSLGTSFPPGGGDGGNVEAGYEIEGGWGRDEAVGLLRRFYVQENGRAPVPRKKEGRAARLAAMMDKDGNGATEETTEEQDDADLMEPNSPTKERSDIIEFDSPMKENVDPRGGDDGIKSHSSTRRVANKDAVLREAENY